MEHWKVILTFPDYAISDQGRVKRVVARGNRYAGRLLKPILHQGRCNYYFVELRRDGARHGKLLHRLLAEMFIPNPMNLPEVNHKNGIKTDFTLSNLEWSTSSDNAKHARAMGLVHPAKGMKNGAAKLTDTQVIKIRNSKESSAGIAKLYFVSKSTVTRIRSGKYWKHI